MADADGNVTGPGGSTPEEQAAIASAEHAAQDREPAAPAAAEPERRQQQQQQPERPRHYVRSNLADIYKSRREEMVAKDGVNPEELSAETPADAVDPDTDEGLETNTDAGAAEPTAAPAAAAPAAPTSSPPAAPASGPQAPAAPTATTPQVVDYDPTKLYRVMTPNGPTVVPGATLLGLAAKGHAASRQAQTPDPAAAAPAAAPATTPATAKADDLDYAEIAKRLVVGTDEEAGQALRQIVETARAGASAADPDAIARKAAELAAEHFRTETALADFKRDYEDLTKDPLLVRLVADHVTALRTHALSTGQHKDEATLLREAGNAVLDWGKSRGMQLRDPREKSTPAPAATTRTPAPASAAPTSLAERREAKRSAPPLVRPATARPSATPEQKRRDPSDYVMQQRKARGQSVA
jgi:hypothetical protein